MAKKPQTILQFYEDNKINILSANRRSYAWYQKKVKELSTSRHITGNADRLIKNGKRIRSRSTVGFLYLFSYSAKNYKTLEYWDRYPLVLPFKIDKNGFTGFNIHYLPYRERSIMLQRCLDFASDMRLDINTRVRLTWNLVSNYSKLESLSYCVKRYRWDHVQSPFAQIPVEDWGLVALMPCHSFVGATSTHVWYKTLGLK